MERLLKYLRIFFAFVVEPYCCIYHFPGVISQVHLLLSCSRCSHGPLQSIARDSLYLLQGDFASQPRVWQFGRSVLGNEAMSPTWLLLEEA